MERLPVLGHALTLVFAPSKAAGDIGKQLGRTLGLLAVTEDSQAATDALAEAPVVSAAVM